MFKFATMMWCSNDQPVYSVTPVVQHVMTDGEQCGSLLGKNSGIAESYTCQQGSLSEESLLHSDRSVLKGL